jgi:hypothetical protein
MPTPTVNDPPEDINELTVTPAKNVDIDLTYGV